MLLIKLGGSIITYKEDGSAPPYYWNESKLHYRIREHELKSAAGVLRSHLDKGMIIIHGGGTHGHRTVRRWEMEVARGTEAMRAWEVKWRMVQLTQEVISSLGSEKIPAVEVSPSDLFIMEGSSIIESNLEPLNRIMDRGCVPILRGDLAPDRNGGWSVISGDEIMVSLAEGSKEHLLPPVQGAVMCMREEGVYSDYGTKKRLLIKEFDPETFHSFVESHNGGELPGDVTGGLLRKLRSCHRIASIGIPARIIGGDLNVTIEEALSTGDPGTLFPPLKDGCPLCNPE
ncbi:MAG: isopentenyl phosphate kinase [Thermoplasmatota archaeon]